MVKRMGEQQGENAGIKLAQRLMVDIMGALIPGTMFWFSVLAGGICPFLFLINIRICYQTIPNWASGGWFWIVAFFAFLIIAYVIGHVFYRSDIKTPDKSSFDAEKLSIIENISREWKKTKKLKNSNVNNVGQYFDEKLAKEIEYLCLLCEEENIDYLCKNENFKFYNNLKQNLEALSSLYKLDRNFDENKEKLIQKIIFNELPIDFIYEEYQEFLIKQNFFAKEISKYKSIVYYYILKLQTECACGILQKCDFPYLDYYKYLLKRGEIRLLQYVNWCTLNTRSKNKLNRYKIAIQINFPEAYSILNINESHIRMASSSWWVANALAKKRVLLCMYLLLVVVLYRNEILDMIFDIKDLSAIDFVYPWRNIKTLMAFVFPAGVYFLLIKIKLRIDWFLHYQRLREIYYTLDVYYEYDQWRKTKEGDTLLVKSK